MLAKAWEGIFFGYFLVRKKSL